MELGEKIIHQWQHSVFRSIKQIKQLHAYLLRTGLFFVSLSFQSKLIFTYTSSLDKDKLDTNLVNCFNFIQPTNPVAFNVLISDFCRDGLSQYALKTFSFMHANGVPLDTYSLCSSFTAATSVGDAELGKQVHGLYVKSGWSSSVFVGSSLVGLYSKLLFIRDAEVVFDEIPVKNTVCANTLLSGYGEAKMWIEGLELARRMPILNLSYDNFSLSAMLRACAGLSAVELGKQVHAYVIHKICDLAKDVFLQSSLIEMYGKCGLVGKARLVFDLAGTELRVQRRKDIVLWTSMLGAYGKNGHFEKVIELYDKMLCDGIKPDGVTFVTLISACCHTGQVKLGIKYFDSMVHHFNLEPGPEHYSCLVDLLCRTGELDKAWKLADEMLAKGNNGTISLWGSLLSSCEDCGNIELGTLAAQKALELEPQNIGIYTKLSNLYARLGMWDEIDRLKESMKQRGLKKDLANSWIEVTT
ncbi:pentatricopeptide repeat-containing protein At1g50270-like [Tripterygium wilfordii]|uniref:pentatricopeptide repeat-containing protein At1g50270-like n=1 Tax=Tripterygium wilfordii TaxID=458696 RepID=UPI0018F804AE|nr:pentatricopeptide repeat-containing protein At1g50270-like [Tripterygium wilfordii]